MSKDNNISSLDIEKYFDGELNKNERTRFEEKVETDAWFARKVRDHHQIRKDLTIQGNRYRIIDDMDEIHLKEFGGIPYLKVNSPEENCTEKDSLDLLGDKNAKTNPFQSTGKFVSVKIFYIGIGVAASLAALITLGSVWVAKQKEHQEVHVNSGYQDLVMEESGEGKDTNNKARKLRTIDKSIPGLSKTYVATAFAIAKNGYFITNNHVVQDCKSLKLKVKGGVGGWLEYDARVLLNDTLTDLAMVQIVDSNFMELGILPFTFSSKSVMMGQDVYTLGYPKKDIVMEPGTLSSTTGLMGDTTAYQLAMSLNSGNSGGPIFNTKGEVVAVVKGKHNGKEGTGYAVRADYMLELIQKYEAANDVVLKKPKYNQIQYKSRVKQISHIRQFVFLVEAEK